MSHLNFIASLFALYFLLAFFLIQIINKQIDFKKFPLSYYALKKYGIIMTLGFFFIGFNQFLISWLLFNQGYLIPSISLLLSGIGVCFVGTFKQENKNGEASKIHEIGAGMQFLFFPIGVIIYSIFSKDYTLSLPIGIITFLFIFLIYYGHSKYKNNQIKHFGIIQKSNILLINSWLLLFPLII